MPKHGRSQAATIATVEPRVVAILSTCAACVLAGSWVSDGPPWVRHAPRPAVVTYLVILAAVLVWGCVRGWHIGLRVGHDGVTVRNFFRWRPESGVKGTGAVPVHGDVRRWR